MTLLDGHKGHTSSTGEQGYCDLHKQQSKCVISFEVTSKTFSSLSMICTCGHSVLVILFWSRWLIALM